MSTPTPSSPSTGLAVVEELARRFQAGEFAAAFELYHPALRIEQPASLPHGGLYEGHEGVRAMGALFGRFWDRTITNPRRMACGEGVVQITTQTWTAKTTGRSATVDVVELISLREGKVSEIRVFQQDTARLLATLDQRSPTRSDHPSDPGLKPWARADDVQALSADIVERLSRHWEDGWNREDVATIVAPFHEQVRFSSPFVGRFGDGDGQPPIASHCVQGLDAVRKYVADSFARATRGIKYTLDAAYAGTNTVALAYTVHHPRLGDKHGLDTMLVDEQGKVVEWRCHYPFEG